MKVYVYIDIDNEEHYIEDALCHVPLRLHHAPGGRHQPEEREAVIEGDITIEIADGEHEGDYTEDEFEENFGVDVRDRVKDFDLYERGAEETYQEAQLANSDI